MNEKFQELIANLDSKCAQLQAATPIRFSQLPKDLPLRGIYLFTEAGTHQYVGRTNNLRRRLQGHCRPSGTHFTATFAFRIARKETGMAAKYKTEGGRAGLHKHDIFGPAFVVAKDRVSHMDIRFVEESDPVRQALLEIYVATSLGTPFNDFENH